MTTPRFLHRDRLLLLIPAALSVAVWLLFLLDRTPGTSAALHGFPLDDAWIHLVYARGLATEGGFHYNPGVAETGMTSPLWVVALAPVHAIAGSFGTVAIVIGAKLLALAFGIAGVITIHQLARALGQSSAVAWIAAMLFALDPSLTFSRAAGMEMPLFSVLVLASLLLAIRARPVWAGTLAGLAIVTRPEGVLVLPALALLLARREIRTQAGAGKRMLLAVALAALPALLYMGFCLRATGVPLPNTFYAKFQAQNPLSLGMIGLGWNEYVHGNLPYFAFEIGAILATLGALTLLVRAPRSSAAVLGTGVLLFTLTLASRRFAPGHYHYWERWLVPAFPFLLLAIAAGVGEIASGFRTFRARTTRPPAQSRSGRTGRKRTEPEATAPRPARMWGIASLAGIGLLVAPLPHALLERAHTYAWNCQNIDEQNVALGRWVDAHLPAKAVIAVNDAGALRYFGKRVTVDLLGLNDHRVRRAAAQGKGLELLTQDGVGWFVVFPAMYSRVIPQLGLVAIHEARSPHYTICDPGTGQDLMVVYRWNNRTR